MSYDPKNFKYRAGLGSVGAYQVSGIPYMSASVTDLIPKSDGTPYQVTFPYISQWVIVENTSTGSNLRVGFSSNGVLGPTVVGDVPELSYIVLPSASHGAENGSGARQRIRLDVRVKDIFLLCDDNTDHGSAQIAAGLTMIPTSSLEGNGTHPNWSGSSGVG